MAARSLKIYCLLTNKLDKACKNGKSFNQSNPSVDKILLTAPVRPIIAYLYLTGNNYLVLFGFASVLRD